MVLLLTTISRTCRYIYFLAICPIFDSCHVLQVNKNAISYPRWVRTMMGVSTAFVIFTFPPDIPLRSYVQILPNMVNYIDDVK